MHTAPTVAAPVFEQEVDASRPHTLLTADPKRSGSLVYRYLDTDEQVRVPNVWYNQTRAMHVVRLRHEAQCATADADKYQKNPPYGMSAAVGMNIADRYRAQADGLRAEADRIEASMADVHTVLAILTD